MPLVSVIINVRNGAATLREAIQSVLAQSFAEWELIVWDDRSTDESANVIQEFRDPRIRYFLSPDDAALGKARHDAIKHTTGEWIAFLDQDDIWLPEKLIKQLALTADDDVGLVYGRTVRFYANGFERDYDHAHEYESLPEGKIFSRLFIESCFIAMSSAMFRRSALDAVGVLPAEVKIIPDYYLYVAVSSQFQVRAVQDVLCRYRMHPDSMSQVQALAMHREAIWLIDQWAPYLPTEVAHAARRRHFTQIALEEMRSGSSFFRGLTRLLTQGSLLSQLLRPFVFLYHIARRVLVRPYWQKLESNAGM